MHAKQHAACHLAAMLPARWLDAIVGSPMPSRMMQPIWIMGCRRWPTRPQWHDEPHLAGMLPLLTRLLMECNDPHQAGTLPLYCRSARPKTHDDPIGMACCHCQADCPNMGSRTTACMTQTDMMPRAHCPTSCLTHLEQPPPPTPYPCPSIATQLP